MQSSTYLFFDGRCEEAFTFYHHVLGGRVTAMMRHAGSPAEHGVPPEWQDKILHACLDLGGFKLMASDAPPGRYNRPQGFCVHLAVGSEAEAERVFAALGEGATIVMPIAQTFWAARFGLLHDRFGTPWMVNCDLPAGAGATELVPDAMAGHA